MKKLFLLIFCLPLGACSSLPQNMNNSHIENISYANVIKRPDGYIDTDVRWGGIIIDVTNKKNFSLIQTLLHPLSYSGEPQLDKPAEGRFIIRSTDFFDPIIYAKNRKITVVGKLNGEIERMVEERVIRVPLILSKNIHLWPRKDFHDFNDYYYGEHDDEWEGSWDGDYD